MSRQVNGYAYDKNIFRDSMKKNLQGRAMQHEEKLEEVENWMATPSAGLILMGSVGTGKTTIACAMRDAWDTPLTIARVRKCDKIADLIKQDETWKTEIAGYTGLLVLDDFGTEPKVWGEESIPYILYRRIENNLPTVITTNLNSEQIKERYGVRIADRLRVFDKIIMDYDSLRGNDTDNH